MREDPAGDGAGGWRPEADRLGRAAQVPADVGADVAVAVRGALRRDLLPPFPGRWCTPSRRCWSRKGLKASIWVVRLCHWPVDSCSGSVAREKRRTVPRPMPSCRAMDRLLWPAVSRAWTVAYWARVRSANRWPVGHGEAADEAADEPGAWSGSCGDSGAGSGRRGAGIRITRRPRRGGVRGAIGRRPGVPEGRRGWRPRRRRGRGSRQTISIPGRWDSQAARVSASRSGRRSTGRRVSTSTRTVPWIRPLR